MTVPGNTIERLAARLSGGETTASAVTADALGNAEALNETLNAFLQIDREGATRRAAELDESAGADAPGGDARPAAPPSAPQTLRGIPLAIKDNICVRG